MLFPPEFKSPLQNLSRTGKVKLNCGSVLLFSIVSPRSIRACPGEKAWGQKDCTRLVVFRHHKTNELCILSLVR